MTIMGEPASTTQHERKTGEAAGEPRFDVLHFAADTSTGDQQQTDDQQERHNERLDEGRDLYAANVDVGQNDRGDNADECPGQIHVKARNVPQEDHFDIPQQVQRGFRHCDGFEHHHRDVAAGKRHGGHEFGVHNTDKRHDDAAARDQSVESAHGLLKMVSWEACV